MSGNFPGGKGLLGFDQCVQGFRGTDREGEFGELAFGVVGI